MRGTMRTATASVAALLCLAATPVLSQTIVYVDVADEGYYSYPESLADLPYSAETRIESSLDKALDQAQANRPTAAARTLEVAETTLLNLAQPPARPSHPRLENVYAHVAAARDALRNGRPQAAISGIRQANRMLQNQAMDT